MRPIIRGDEPPWRWLPRETLDRALVLGAALAALAAAACLPMLGSRPHRVALIASMGVLLAAFAARTGGWLVAAPFGFAAVGAALLGFDDGRLLMPALLSFLIAHVLYARVFILYSVISYSPITGYRLVAALFVIAHAIVFAALLWPSTGTLRVPVLICTGANLIMVLVMVLAALRLCVSNVPAGAIAFMMFNGLLGFDTFIELPRWIEPAIWIMYMLGQLMIAHGLLIQPQSNEDTARALEHAISRRRRMQGGEPCREPIAARPSASLAAGRTTLDVDAGLGAKRYGP